MRPFLVYLLTALLLLLLTVACVPISKKSTLLLSERSANNLIFLYDHVDTEYAFCVFGSVAGKEITVEHIELPYIQDAQEDSVTWWPCDGENFLGMGHSHPGGSCEFSDLDIKALVKTDAPYGFLICKDHEMVWYSKKHVLAQMKAQSNGR